MTWPRIEPRSPPTIGEHSTHWANSTITIFLQGWLWYLIIQEVWLAIKQRKPTKLQLISSKFVFSHTHTHTHIHAYTHTHTDTWAHVTHRHTDAWTYATHTHTHTDAWTHAIYTRAHTHTHTHIYVYIYIYMKRHFIWYISSLFHPFWLLQATYQKKYTKSNHKKFLSANLQTNKQIVSFIFLIYFIDKANRISLKWFEKRFVSLVWPKSLVFHWSHHR